MKRRSLVITDESARHPFRARLVPQGRQAARARAARSAAPRWFTLDDLRQFLMAYCACFLAVSLYIA